MAKDDIVGDAAITYASRFPKSCEPQLRVSTGHEPEMDLAALKVGEREADMTTILTIRRSR